MRARSLAAFGTFLLAGTSIASAAELNIYSSRHYDTDEALYSGFEEETGITVNRIEADADELIERIRAEGEDSPADILITVDAGRLWRADQEGLLEPIESDVLAERIPAAFRHPEGHWFGFSKRARIIYYDKEAIDPALIQTYEDLASDEIAGEVCIRSSSNIYNLSLMASLIEHHGEAEALAWAEGVTENFARQPEGGDTDQITAIAAGECGVALANHYYFVRLLASDDPAVQEVTTKVGHIFPNQDGRGTHVNVSGAGVVKGAPNHDAAVQFLEYLASDQAQRYFAAGNYEFPVVEGIDIDDENLASLGEFKEDALNVSALGSNQPTAQIVYDKAGWR